MATKIHVMRKFGFEIRPEIRRLAIAGMIASLLAIAVNLSRNENFATEVSPQFSKQKFQQPRDREQADGWFIPTRKMVAISDGKEGDIASVIPQPRPLPNTPGFYYELVRVQGDGEDGEYVLVERKCIPKIDMPEPCYLPERERQKFPLRRP